MSTFQITSSQKNFLIGPAENIWNNGMVCFFNKVYDYEQMNDTFNSFVEKFESTRIRLIDSNQFTKIISYEKSEYPFLRFENKRKVLDFAGKIINNPINLKDNSFTCYIFNTETQSGYIVLSHHLILDGYSGSLMNIFLYNNLNGKSFDKPIESYKQHIQNDFNYIKSKRYKKANYFWHDQFSLNPNCSIFQEKQLPFDYASDEVNFSVPSDLFDKIKVFCSSNNISIQSFFNTIYSTYIFRTLGTDFFTMGVPVLNRTTEAELNTIGLYMHILPMLINVSEASFLENVLTVEDAQMNLFRHQKFTQHDIKELLKEEGRPQNNLFDIATDYQEFEENEDYEFEFIYSKSLSMPLEFHMQSFGKKKHNLKIRYRTSMFTEKEIQIMINSFISIIEDALEHPDKKISELEILSAEEKQKVLYDFNDTEHNYCIPDNSTLFSLFEKTARENTDKICIKTSEKNMTFGELLNISENLDAEIHKITKGEKSVIAVIAERSPEMYGAIYGIIRGGNAYLPIDPSYPQARIDYILRNSNAAVVIVQGKFAQLTSYVPCINMTDFMFAGHDSTDIPLCSAVPEDTAYVIYTSGSTGNPKGAKVSHKSAVNRILWMHDKYPLGNKDVILQKTPYTFDVSVWELFWWGMCGSSLAASKPGEHFLPAKILEEVYKNGVTHLHFVPSVFELFLNYMESHEQERYKFDSVRYVFLSGEALAASFVQRFYKLYDCSKVTLHNLYGPTECAIDVTYYDCIPTDVDPIPIGKPIYNTRMYVVDKYINLVPIGETGELCIAGVNVGQGYLGNPGITGEKFIDNPFGEGKLYKTGDIAYWREDGQLVFCGRKDAQIKLNGQRIETGEIEAVISSLAEVDSVAVVVKKDSSKDMLVAFYTGKCGEEKAVRDFCFGKLPKYMVPAVVVHLDEMPLNQSGKLDRRALRSTEVKVVEKETQAPVTDSERYICEIFCRILNTDNIGRNSDFFEMGGTSLSMISLLSEKEFENITAAEFLNNPTPSGLALSIEKKRHTDYEYLEPLHIAEKSDRILILLPFAGGGAETYSSFVNALKKKNKHISVYFIPYLHSTTECKKAADEIAVVFAKSEISVYSHCVGAAVALQIIKRLEETGVSVNHYYAGASIPPSKPTEKNIWNITPDRVILAILSRAGANIEELTYEKRRDLLARFRNDTDFANISFAGFNDKIKTPVSIILSKKDIFTKNYSHAEKIWKKYAENVKEVCFIDSKSHYFQSDDSELLLEKIYN